MPALVYSSPGSRSRGSHVSIGNAGRVHDPADAALLPRRLAARRLARRADLARALRPHLRVPRPAGRHRGARTRDARADARRRRASTTSGSATATRAWTLQDVSFEVPPARRRRSSARRAPARRRLGYLVARLYDVTRGRVTIDGVDVRELTFDVARGHGRRRLAGDVSLPRDRAREPPLRQARRDRRGGRGGGAGGADPRADLVAARGLRDRRRRARLPLLGRREAADRDRADDPAQPADPRARRGDLSLDTQTERAGAGGARAARGGPDDDRDRAPALDRARRRPDRRARPRPRRRDRHARGAARRGRALRVAGVPRHRGSAQLAETRRRGDRVGARAPCPDGRSWSRPRAAHSGSPPRPSRSSPRRAGRSGCRSASAAAAPLRRRRALGSRWRSRARSRRSCARPCRPCARSRTRPDGRAARTGPGGAGHRSRSGR